MATDTQANPLTALAALSLPDADGITRRAQSSLTSARDFAVTDAQTYEMCADEVRGIKARLQRLEDMRTSITGPLNTALKAVNDLFRAPREALELAERAYKGKMLAYSEEQERIAAEARRKAEAEAAAERERLAAQAKAAEEEAAKHTEAAQQGDLLASVVVAEKQAEAAQLQTAAQIVQAAPVVANVPKVKGASVATTYDFEVFDLLALVKHVAAHPELIGLLQVDSVRMRNQVRATQANTQLPGVRVFQKKSQRI